MSSCIVPPKPVLHAQWREIYFVSCDAETIRQLHFQIDVTQLYDQPCVVIQQCYLYPAMSVPQTIHDKITFCGRLGKYPACKSFERVNYFPCGIICNLYWATSGQELKSGKHLCFCIWCVYVCNESHSVTCCAFVCRWNIRQPNL